MRIVVCCVFAIVSSSIFGQTPTGASARGNCNIVISGSNNTVTPATLKGPCTNGITKEQADKFVNILNTVLTKKDAALINAKLDELLQAANRPVQVMNCEGSNCVLGNNYAPQTYNQFGPPPAHFTCTEEIATSIDSSPDKVETLKIHVKTDRSVPGAVVGIRFSGPVELSKGNGDPNDPTLDHAPMQEISWGPLIDANEQPLPNAFGWSINMPAAFAPGMELNITVRAKTGVHVLECVPVAGHASKPI